MQLQKPMHLVCQNDRALLKEIKHLIQAISNIIIYLAIFLHNLLSETSKPVVSLNDFFNKELLISFYLFAQPLEALGVAHAFGNTTHKNLYFSSIFFLHSRFINIIIKVQTIFKFVIKNCSRLIYLVAQYYNWNFLKLRHL